MANSRLKYGGNYFEFARKMNVFRSVDTQLRKDFTSLSGMKEFLNFYTSRKITIGRGLSKPGEIAGLRSFWEYAKDGSSFTFERDSELGIYMNFDGDVTTNDGLDYTYDCNDEQLFWTSNQLERKNSFTKFSRVSQTDGSTPRFVQDDSEDMQKGLLIEGAGTNEILYSDDFYNASWTKSGVIIASNNTDVEAPDGTFTADRMHGAGTIEQSAGALTGQSVVASCYVYDLAGYDVNIKIKSSTSGILATNFGSIGFSAGWRRIYVSYSGSLAGNISIVIENTNASSNVLLWGAQLEKRITASSYMQSVGTSGTRSGESLEIPLSPDYFSLGYPKYNAISFWIYPYFGHLDQSWAIIFQLLKDSTGNSFLTFEHTYSGIDQWNMYGETHDGFSGFTNAQNSSLFGEYNPIHIFIEFYHKSGGNVAKIYANGALLTGTGSNTFTDYSMVYDPDTLVIGARGGALSANMVISEFTSYRGKEFTADEISDLAAATVQQGHPANRYENLTLVNTDFIDELKPGTSLKGFELEFEKV